MNGTVAIVTADPEWFTVLRLHLQLAGIDASQLAAEPLQTVDDATDWADKGGGPLLVLDAGLPLDPRKRRDDARTVAAESILEHLRNKQPAPPVLVIATSMERASAVLRICADLGDALVLPDTSLRTHWELVLKPFLAMLMRPNPPDAQGGETAIPGTFRVIEADLLRDRVEIRLGTDLPNQPLLLWNTLTDLDGVKQAARAYDIPEAPDGTGHQGMWDGVRLPTNWLEQSRVVGTTLFRKLIVEAIGPHLFSAIEGAAGGLEGLAFRFVISESDYYPAPFEASVRSVQSVKDGAFVLLFAPLVRRVPPTVRLRTMRRASMPERPTVLFVRSQMGEFPGDERGYMAYANRYFAVLGNIDVERSHLRKLHEARKIILQEANLSQAAPGKAAMMILQAVNTHRPDIVHYAGHAWSDGRGDATLILPGTSATEAMGLKLARFATFDGLAAAKLIYLSACRGISKDSMQHLVMNGIPHALGFRWSVDDDKAPDFAQAFYEELCRVPSVSRAFRHACRTSWQSLELEDASTIWIAPILLAQTADWAIKHAPSVSPEPALVLAAIEGDGVPKEKTRLLEQAANFHQAAGTGLAPAS